MGRAFWEGVGCESTGQRFVTAMELNLPACLPRRCVMAA
jgi:hypothetical protein